MKHHCVRYLYTNQPIILSRKHPISVYSLKLFPMRHGSENSRSEQLLRDNELFALLQEIYG